MGSLVGHYNLICHRIFLPYKITPIFEENHKCMTYRYYEKSLNYFFLYMILWQIRFFCPTRLPMGILEMDFERMLGVPFYHSSSHSIMLWQGMENLTKKN